MRLYAEVIGDPVAQSKSPAIHTHWLGALGVAADYRACPVAAAALADYLTQRRDDPEWCGCNVTMPHKQAIIGLVDRLDPLAARIGAVNTVIRAGDGSLAGFNTDAGGFLEPLRPVLASPPRLRSALVLGTGGAARAVVAALAGEGVTVALAGRDPAKARALLEELDPAGGHRAADLASFAAPAGRPRDQGGRGFDLIVNASPLGMAGQPPLAFDLSHARPDSIVYDIVTHPLDTPLLRAARAAGLRTIDGLAMLIGQAATAFTLFFGEVPPREDRDRALREVLAR